MDAETGKPANGQGVAPMFAFVGDNMTLFRGQTHPENSQVTFYTRRITGKREAATIGFSLEDKDKFRVDMVPPFVKHSFKELPRLSLRPEWEKALQERAIGVQATQLYIADSVSRTDVIPGYIRTQPDWVYKLDEYMRFPTMQDIVIEFITPLRFTRRGQDRSLSILTEERVGFNRDNTLLLVDGVPISDHNVIFNYDPLLVEKIDIYSGYYTFSESIFNGIVFFHTYKHDYPGLRVGRDTQFFDYEGTLPKRHFDMPDYRDPQSVYRRLPDYRHTLLWMPEVVTGGQNEVIIPFTTSDLTGSFLVNVEGITTTWDPVSGTAVIEVIP